MAAIREIVIQNVKGQDTVQQLTGKDIIIGQNGVGKTTRLQALGISLLGYVPGHGKLPAETFKLSTGDEMTVGLKTDQFSFSRTFQKNEKSDRDGNTVTSIKQKITVSPSRGEKKNSDCEGRISAEMGNFPVMMDFNEFLSLSDAKRREFIYSLSGFDSEKWSRARVQQHLEDTFLTPELEVNDPDKYQIMSQVISTAMKEYPVRYEIQSGLQSMMVWASNKLSFWKKEKQKSEGAVKKIAELKNQLSETDRNIAQNKEELEALQQQLIQVEKQISADTEKQKAIASRFQKIETLQKEVAEEKATNMDDHLKNLNDLKAELEALKTDFTQELEVLHVKKREAGDQYTKLQQEAQSLHQAITKQSAAIDALKGPLAVIEKQAGKCVIDQRIGCNKDFTAYVDHMRTKIEADTQEVQTLKIKYLTMDKEIDALRRLCLDYDRDLYLIHQQERGARQKEVTLNNKINTLENFIGAFEEKLMFKERELADLQAQPVEPTAPMDLLEKQKEGLAQQIKDLNAKLDEQEKAKITLSNLKSSMIDSKEASHHTDCFKYLSEALGAKGIQGELAKETLGPIQEAVQENLSMMGVDHEFFFSTESDNGKEIFQFGWVNEKGHQVNFNALSTGQKLMVLIALMVAMIEKAAPPVRVLAIDNIENLDRRNTERVLKGLNQISVKLDNIILCGVIDIENAEGFTVWNLSRGVVHE